MSEFLFPSYGEWLAEYEQVMSASVDLRPADPSTAFSHLSPLPGEILGLPSRRDYYEPERAALVLETLYHLPPSMKPGGVAYATWMAKLADDRFPQFLPTSLMGAEICRGLASLGEKFALPESLVQYIRKVLSSRSYDEFPAVAAEIVGEWLQEGRMVPLAVWLRERVITRSGRG